MRFLQSYHSNRLPQSRQGKGIGINGKKHMFYTKNR